MVRRDNAAMNNTHNFETTEADEPPTASGGRPIDELAAMDPADAPPHAEQYAMDLAAELEEVGAAASDPVQLQADLNDRSELGPDGQ